jgi:hypothetical protein
MNTTGIAARVARLERSTGGDGPCPRHDIAIGARRVENGVMTVTSEPVQHSCRRCGQPASDFWIELTVVPDRQREEPGQ